MYEREFDTDWETLDREGAIERAFALGVAASLDEPLPGEYERVLGEAGSTYDRSIVELAYEEGRTRARKLRYSSEDDDEVWSELVDDVEIDPPGSESDPPEGNAPAALGRFRGLDPPDDDLDYARLPDFLTR